MHDEDSSPLTSHWDLVQVQRIYVHEAAASLRCTRVHLNFAPSRKIKESDFTRMGLLLGRLKYLARGRLGPKVRYHRVGEPVPLVGHAALEHVFNRFLSHPETAIKDVVSLAPPSGAPEDNFPYLLCGRPSPGDSGIFRYGEFLYTNPGIRCILGGLYRGWCLECNVPKKFCNSPEGHASTFFHRHDFGYLLGG